MPTYEFRCPNGHTFEQFHRISDAPTAAPCPTCAAEAERVISGGAGLVFKGSGFYLTDYGKNAHRGNGPAKNGEGATGGGSGEKSGEKSSSDKASSDAPAGGSGGSSTSGGSAGTSGGSTGGSGSGASSGGSGASSTGPSGKSGE